MPRAAAFWSAVLLLGSTALVEAQSTTNEQNPVRTFSTIGPHQVTLEVCNLDACETITRTVQVLDPAPAIVSAVVGAATAEVGQLVSLSGSGTGQPPLVYTWRLLQGAVLVREVSGALGWLDTTGLEPGAYTVVLRLSNGTGQVESLPASLTVVPAVATDFYTLTPCRVLDTRSGSPLQSGVTRLVSVVGTCGIPAGTRALAANVTTVSPTNPGSLVVFPGNYPDPGTATAHLVPGRVLANEAVLPLSTDGAGNLALLAQGGSVHVLIDVFGYFMP